MVYAKRFFRIHERAAKLVDRHTVFGPKGAEYMRFNYVGK